MHFKKHTELLRHQSFYAPLLVRIALGDNVTKDAKLIRDKDRKVTGEVLKLGQLTNSLFVVLILALSLSPSCLCLSSILCPFVTLSPSDEQRSEKLCWRKNNSRVIQATSIPRLSSLLNRSSAPSPVHDADGTRTNQGRKCMKTKPYSRKCWKMKEEHQSLDWINLIEVKVRCSVMQSWPSFVNKNLMLNFFLPGCERAETKATHGTPLVLIITVSFTGVTAGLKPARQRLPSSKYAIDSLST